MITYSCVTETYFLSRFICYTFNVRTEMLLFLFYMSEPGYNWSTNIMAII